MGSEYIISELAIDGAYLIKPIRIEDNRGYNLKLYSKKETKKLVSI